MTAVRLHVAAAAVAPASTRTRSEAARAPSRARRDGRSTTRGRRSTRRTLDPAPRPAHRRVQRAPRRSAARRRWLLDQSAAARRAFRARVREEGADAAKGARASPSAWRAEGSAAAPSVARAVVSAAPDSRAVYPMPRARGRADTFRAGVRVAGRSPTALAFGTPREERSNEATRGERAAKKRTSGLARAPPQARRRRCRARRRRTRATLRARARVAAPFVAGLCAPTRARRVGRCGQPRWGVATKRLEFSGGAAKRGPASARLRLARRRRRAPRACCGGGAPSAGTAFGLVHGRLGRRSSDARGPRRTASTLRAVMPSALAVARAGASARARAAPRRARVSRFATRRTNVSGTFPRSRVIFVVPGACAVPGRRRDAWRCRRCARGSRRGPRRARRGRRAARPRAGTCDLLKNLPVTDAETRRAGNADDAADDDDAPRTFRDARARVPGCAGTRRRRRARSTARALRRGGVVAAFFAG